MCLLKLQAYNITYYKKVFSLKLCEGLRTNIFRSSRSQLFFKIGVFLKISVLESLFNKVAGLKACSFIKTRLQHKCFPVKFAKFLRTPFFTEHPPPVAIS